METCTRNILFRMFEHKLGSVVKYSMVSIVTNDANGDFIRRVVRVSL